MLLTHIARIIARVVGWALAYAYMAFVIVASLVAALCGMAVVAFIILEGYALLTGNG